MQMYLFRSPVFPDPEAGRGEHSFPYALLPHQGARDGQGIVPRLYEAVGKATVTALHTDFPCRFIECDLMENPIGSVDGQTLAFSPFEIKTLKAIPR